MIAHGILKNPLTTTNHRVSFASQPSSHHAHDEGDGHRHSLAEATTESTLQAVEQGFYGKYDLRPILKLSKQNTRYYPPDSLLSAWATASHPSYSYTDVLLYPSTTLQGARILANMQLRHKEGHAHQTQKSQNGQPITQESKIGVLNFATPTKPGGGFRHRKHGQEESLARSSTLYLTLTTRVAQVAYYLHYHFPKSGYYSHAMVYSPNIVLIRDDNGTWVEPLVVDVVSSTPVNARMVRQGLQLQGTTPTAADEAHIAAAMKERMARVLYLFEMNHVRDIVLGAFGAGSCANNADLVARLWTELLLDHGARFRHSFGRVLIAVPSHQAFEEFKHVFARYNG
ncbi:hypothetical protein NM688_g88 [Phlebia brevispora]|uniref:Uncharacterized protein n=1 Tax=Phlebia brevispora TaxID=194682 RepID=A0ACC1TFD5_9APHY|nr:hypothetical protein NM688_g88 [Phlebia brevispora]